MTTEHTSRRKGHLEAIEQVAIHVADIESEARLWRQLGLGVLPVMGVALPTGASFPVHVSAQGVSIVQTEPHGLRTLGFAVRGLEQIKQSLGGFGITPFLEFDADGYDEAHFLVDGTPLSFAEHEDVAPERAKAALFGGLLRVESDERDPRSPSLPRSVAAEARGPGESRIERLEEFSLRTSDLELTTEIYRALGVRFLPTMRAVVDGEVVRVAVSDIGITLVEAAEGGLRSIGLKVSDLDAAVAVLESNGVEVTDHVTTPGYSEARAVVSGEPFALAAYGPTVRPRIATAVIGGLTWVE